MSGSKSLLETVRGFQLVGQASDDVRVLDASWHIYLYIERDRVEEREIRHIYIYIYMGAEYRASERSATETVFNSREFFKLP